MALAPAAPAIAADPAPPCSTKSIDEGTAYTVPAGVSKVRITSYGEAGEAGRSAIGPPREGGAGSKVTADVAVSAGDVLQTVRVDGGGPGLGGQPIRYEDIEYGRNGTRGGTARGVVRVESDCRRYLVLAGGGGGNGSDDTSPWESEASDFGLGLSSSGGAAGLGPSQPAGRGQHGTNDRNAQEDGAGGGGATLTAGGGGGAGGRDSLSFCADGFGGGGGAFETPGGGADGREEDDCEGRSGGGGGGAGYYGGGGGGSHQDDDSGSGAGGGGSSYVVDGASNVSYQADRSGAGTTIVPIYTPAGAPASVTAAPHNRKATVSFTAPVNTYPIESYTITSVPGGFTTSVTGTGALSGTVTGLTNGTAYRFTVTAVPTSVPLVDGSPAVSPQSNQVTPTTERPTAVRNFTATAGDGTAQLTWDPPADDGGSTIIDYTVTWPSGAGSRGQVATGTSMTVNQGLTNGQAKQFTIVPRNAVGDGPSSFTSATPRAVAVPVKQPTPTGTGGNGFVNVQFTPAEPGYDQFIVTTTPAPNCGDASTTHAADYGFGFPYGVRVGCLSNGVSYRFSVAARNDQGVGPESDLSDPVIPTTTAPTYVSATVERGVNALLVKPDGVDTGGSPVTSFSAFASPFQAPGVDVSQVVTVPVPTPGAFPDITIPGLVTGVLYQVFIAATNAKGTMAYTSVGYARPYGVPDAPTDVTVEIPSDGDGEKVDLTFRTTQRAECGRYEITAEPGGLTKTGAIGPAGPECGQSQFNRVTFGGLTNGTPYTFTVRVIDDLTGPSPASAETAPITPYATKRAGSVSNVVAVPAGNGKVRLTFDPSPDDWKYPVTYYRVNWDGDSTQIDPDDVDDGILVTSLTNDREYRFNVVAHNQIGDSDPVLSDGVTPTALATPTNLDAEVGNGTARLSFDGVDNNGGGDLEYVVTLGELNDEREVVTDSSPVLLTGLENDEFYQVTVRARNADGESGESDYITVQAINGLPAMPTNVTATAGLAQATISWDRVVPDEFRDEPIEDYTVTAHPGGAQVDVNDAGSGPGRVSTTMTGLTNGTTYTFTVHANVDTCPAGRCDGLESDPSNAVTPDRLTQDPIDLTPTSGTYGQALIVSASGGSGTGQLGDITASGDACTLNGNQLMLLHATSADRTCTISVTRAGDDDYKPRTSEQVVTIAQKALTVTARDQDAVYGDTFAKEVDFGTFASGDVAGSLGGTLTFGGTAVTAPGAGTRTLTPGGLTSSDYDLQFVSGTVTFDPMPVTLQVESTNKPYGAPNPPLNANVIQDLVGDDELEYTLSTTATEASRPGAPYPITVSLGTNPNYDIRVVGGMLAVDPAPLTITADDVTAPYGSTPDFTVTPTGLIEPDTLDEFDGTLQFDVRPAGPPPTDSFVLEPFGLSSPYYDIQYVNGTLTRTKRTAQVTWATPAPIEYGTALGPDQLSATSVDGGTYTYSPGPDTVLHAGTHLLTVEFQPFDAEHVLPTTETVEVEVTTAPLTVTTRDDTKVYGAGNPVFGVDYDGLVNDDEPGSLSGTLAFATAADRDSHVGDYPVTPSGLTSDDYEISFDAGSLSVTKAPLTVTTRDASREYGEPNPAFAVDYDGFVNDDDEGSLSGTTEFTTAADEGSPVAEYPVMPHGLASGDYEITYEAGTLTVTKAGPGLSWATPDPLAYGTGLAAAQLDATADVPGTFTYSPPLETVLHAGTRTLTVDFVPTDSDAYRTASTTVQVEVTKAPLTITTQDTSKVYGEANPAFDVDHDGFVNGDGPSSLAGTLEFDTDADADSPVGDYPVTPSGRTSSDYTIGFVAGTLSVTKASTTVSWSDPDPVVYGTALSAAQLDATTGVPGTYTYVPALDAVLHAGTHDLTVSFVPTDTLNYQPSSKTVHLEVTKAPLTVTTDDASKVYLDENPDFTVDYDGFVNGDGFGALSGTVAFTTAADEDSPVGDYPVTPSGLSSSDYAIDFEAGTLSITKSPTTVSWTDPDPIVYGTVLTADQLNATVGVPGTYTYSPAAGTVLHAGSHDLTVDFVPTDTDNYQSSSRTVQLQVTKAPLTITADDATKTFGQANPEFTASYGPFEAGDTKASLNGTLSFDTTADSSSPAGAYPITASGLSSPDYDIQYVEGTLQVAQATPSITWSDPAPIGYGTALTAAQLNATADVPGTFSYTPALGTVLHAGSRDLTVDFVPDNAADYEPTSMTVQLEVTKAPLTVTADNATRSYGQPDPALTVSFSAFRNGDTASSLSGTVQVTTASLTSPVGDYPIVASGLSSPDYDIAYLPGTLRVTKASPSITWADPAPIVFGTPLSASQLAATAAVPGTMTYSPALGTVLRAGSGQVLEATFVPEDTANYEPTSRTVRLDVAKAPLTVTVRNATKTYGEANPEFAVKYGAFEAGDSAATLGGTLTYATPAGRSSQVGEYPITASGLSSPDYAISYVDGTLKVTRTKVVVSADDVSLDRSDRARRIALSATLTSATSGEPIVGLRVVFTLTKRDGNTLTCADRTGRAGTATCRTRAIRTEVLPRSGSYQINSVATRNEAAGEGSAKVFVR